MAGCTLGVIVFVYLIVCCCIGYKVGRDLDKKMARLEEKKQLEERLHNISKGD